MRIKLRSRLMLLFMSLAMVIAIPAMALADQVTNTLDTTIDSDYEVMALDKGASKNTTLYVNQDSDGKSGCDFTGNKTLKVSVNTSNSSVATVSPSNITFSNCNDVHQVTVTGVGEGSANITLRETSNDTGYKIGLDAARFTVNVSNPPPANTAPKVTLNGVDGGAVYEKGSVPAATCSVVDAEDGNSSFPAALSGTLDANGYGSQTATCSYTDKGGLTETVATTYSVTETKAPSSVHSLSADANANGWHKEDVRVNLSANDNPGGSGVKEIRYSINGGAEQVAAGSSEGILVDSEGTTTISYHAVDNFGNAESPANTATVKLDKTAPAISGTDINDTTWRNSNLSQDFTASDALSGLAANQGLDANSGFKLTASNESANASTPTTDSKTVKDAAGNQATRSLSALIDKTNPNLGIADNNAATYNVCQDGPSKPGFDPSDVLSGIDPAKTSDNWASNLQPSGVGSYSYSAQAHDVAGNLDSYSKTYKVMYGSAYSGILQPINATGSSVFKLGSTVPVKFKMMCGTQPISNTVAKLSYQKIDANVGTDVNEAISTSAATEGNLFRYDATSQQYIFNLSTKSLSQGTWKLNIVLDDGTTKNAQFDIKK